MRRRKFISFSLAGLAGATLGTTAISGFLASCSNPNRKISAALVGCSDEAIELLAGTLAGIENITLKQVFDFDGGRAGQAAQSLSQMLGYEIGQAPDLQSVLGEKDTLTVFLFLPLGQVHKVALQTIEAGKDLYISGQPAFSIPEGKQLAEAARKHKRVVQCGFQLRSAPSVQAAKTYIDSGNLGQVVHIKVFSLKKGSDERISLDLARLMVGDPGNPTSVYGYCTAPEVTSGPLRQITTWDFEKFTMACESGSAYQYMQTAPVSMERANVVLPWLLRAERIEVYGQKGLLYLDPVSGSWQVQGNKGEVLASQSGKTDLAAHISNFVTAVRTRELPIADISQGYLSIHLIHMGNLACQAGNKQLLFDDTEEVFTNNEQANSLL